MKAIYDVLPYQQTLIDHLQGGGYKRGEMAIIMSGRQAGKSMRNLCQMYGSMTTPAKFTILDQAPVDGATWYTVTCNNEVSVWMREQSKELQHSHIDGSWTIFQTKFDIHEKLYTMMALKWS